MLTIKPHHFMDIIKLYGKGIEVFVPEPEYHHHFYLVANEIISNQQTLIKVTTGQDDICAPCKCLGKDGRCIDRINHIAGVSLKDDWNKTLDRRILAILNVKEASIFSAREFCQILYTIKERISDIWQEEASATTAERYNYFCKGVQKYLGLE